MRWWLMALALTSLVSGSAGPARGEELVRETREIVVEDERLRPAEIFEDGPIETEVIEAEEIERLPATNAAEVVARLPGIRTQQRVQGEEAAVSIEGMPPEYTKVLVNGQRFTGALDGVTDLADIPVHNVERIEILRGNQGARYGTEAAGGVINIVTRRAPEEGVRFDVEGGAGNDGQVRGDASAAFRLGRTGILLSGGHEEIDGYELPEGSRFSRTQAGSEDSEFPEHYFYGTVDHDLRENLTLHSRLGWRREDYTYAVDPDSALFAADGSTRQKREYETWTSTTGFQWLASEATQVTADFTYFSGVTDSQVGRSFEQEETQYKVDLAVDHVLETGPLSHVLLGAVDFRRSFLGLGDEPLPSDVQLDESRHRIGDVDERFYETGLFFESETAFWRWATLLLSVRLQTHSRFDAAVLPQVGLMLTPHETLKIRLGWGRNRRNPALRDLYQPASPQLGGSYFLEGNPDLQPESSQSWRAGFEWSPIRQASLSVTGFWNDFDDSIRSVLDDTVVVGSNATEGAGEAPVTPAEIDADFFQLCSDPLVGFRLPGCDRFVGAGGGGGGGGVTGVPANLFRKHNLDSVVTRGIEVRLDVRPHALVELEVGYTLLDTEVRDSDRPQLRELPNEPEHVFHARLYATLPRAGTRFAIEAEWRDRAIVETSGTGLLGFSDPDTLSDPAFLLNLRIAQPVWRRVEVFLDARNLTNQRIVDSYAIRGRTFFIGVRATFHPSWDPMTLGGRS